jgi:hypothetical protein
MACTSHRRIGSGADPDDGATWRPSRSPTARRANGNGSTTLLGQSRRTEAIIMLLRRGDIAIERLTGKRTMVIHVTGPDEVTCRFGDGRLEDRFVFELGPTPPTWMDTLFSLITSPPFLSPFLGEGPKKRPPTHGSGAVRQRIARAAGASASADERSENAGGPSAPAGS